MTRPVYVHGVGAISPLGSSWPASFTAIAAGKSAVRWVDTFDVTGFPCQAAAWIERPLETNPTLDRRMALAQIAADEAWRMCSPLSLEGLRGVFIGAESGRATLGTIMALARAGGLGDDLDHRVFEAQAAPLASSFDASAVSPATVASQLSASIGATGPSRTISLACASSNAAIVEAARAISAGLCEVALCGGVGADVDPLMLAGFGLLSALSAHGLSCPFDIKRDGFIVGEGAAMLVLSAKRQGAIAQVLGTGRSLDAYHLTKPHPEGQGAKAAMRAALAEAKLKGVDYVQAHGTSTPLNDAVEARALQEVLGAHLDDALVSSVKGAVGHWIAGAGAIGALCAIEALRQGVAPPTAGLTVPDPECELPHVIGQAQRAPIKTSLVNSFAFGGANSTIIFGRCT